MVLPLILIKVTLGIIFGIAIDLIYKKQVVETHEAPLEDVTCQDHHHKDHDDTKFHKHFIHPLIHSLELFVYVFVINVALGLIIAAVGEENFAGFIVQNKYLSPLFGAIIGLIPNCVSSVLLSELYVAGHLSFGSLLAGLLVNSGLGITVLIKNKNMIKIALVVVGICFAIAVSSGYIACLISGF